MLRNAPWYKRLQARLLSMENPRYLRAVERYKRELLGGLRGEVVEIGPGGGVNLPFYGPDVRWTGVEPNVYMHARLRERGRLHGRDVQVRQGTAEDLPFPDGSVDAVVSTLVLCSVGDPSRALAEILRVLRPGGRFVFIEHVADSRGGWRETIQHAARPVCNVLADGCNPDRRTWETIENAGFSSVELEHFTLPFPVVGPHIAGFAVK